MSDEIARVLFVAGFLCFWALVIRLLLRKTHLIAGKLARLEGADWLTFLLLSTYSILLLSAGAISFFLGLYPHVDMGRTTVGSVLIIAGVIAMLISLTGSFQKILAAISTAHCFAGVSILVLGYAHAGMGGEQAADLWFRTIPLSVLLNIIIPGGVTVLILRTHAKKSNAGQNP